MLRQIVPFSIDIANEPYVGGPAGLDSAALAVLLIILAITVVICAVSLVRAVKSEKRARSMQQSAEFTSQLLNAITEAQKASETPLTVPTAAPGTDAADMNDAH